MPPPRPIAFVVSCEHAGREVPGEIAPLFRGDAAVRTLASHRGWDIGALGVARELASRLRVRPIATTISRLVVEVNRSPGIGSGVFSEFTRGLDARARTALIERYYTPHRDAVERAIARLVSRGFSVAHIGVHSFTPVLDGVARVVQVGLLFDPARSFESALCERWRGAITGAEPSLDVRFNEPYKGVDDGLTTSLRTKFADEHYAGIEIEVRSDLVTRGPAQRRFGTLLAESVPR